MIDNLAVVEPMVARMKRAGWEDTGCAPIPGSLDVDEPIDELRARVRAEHAAYLAHWQRNPMPPWHHRS